LFGINVQKSELEKVRKRVPLAVGVASSRRARFHWVALNFYLLSAVGAFLLSLAGATLGHAKTLDSERPPKYFHSSLSSLTSSKNESIAFCGNDCLTEKYVLAKRSKRKSSVRKVSHSSKRHPDLELNTDYFLNIFSDAKYILFSPLHWKGSDWFKASLVVGVTGAFFTLDDEIRSFVQDKRSGTTDNLANIFEPFGNGGFALPGLVGFYLYGHFFKNPKAERVALLAVESFAVTGLFNTALKFSTGRTRPQSAQNSRQWNGFSTSDNSFASGHTSTVFAIATVLASEYKNNPWVPPVAYGLATLTGLSRLNDNKHWASDVFFGGMLGYFISKTLIKLHSSKKGRHYTIYPRISKNETGLVFAMRF